MIRHVVSWTLIAQDPSTKAENASMIRSRLLSLPALIPEIRSMAVSVNAVPIEGNWDLLLIADYDDEHDLRTYIAHPEHQRVVAEIKAFFASRASVDVLV